MTGTIYRVHAGQELSQAKAAEIVRSKGTVTVLRGDAEARVSGGSWFGTGTPAVSWASYGAVSAGRAADMAEAIGRAADVARLASQEPSHFESCPPWVLSQLGIEQDASELVRYRAASRYANGDVDYATAWQHAVETV